MREAEIENGEFLDVEIYSCLKKDLKIKPLQK
jgi:hypothetical protein